MTTSSIRLKTELFLGVFGIALIPINKHAVVIVLSIWFIVALTNFLFDYPKKALSFNRDQLIFLGFPLLYIIHLIGLCYTTNFDYAFFDLEIKLSILLIPITLWLRFEYYINRQFELLLALIYGSLISFIINLIIACINYYNHPDIIYFYYAGLSPIHPSYMSLYVSLALFSILYLGPKKVLFEIKNAQLIGYSLFVILLIYLFLLSSKAGIISFLITLVVFLTVRLKHKIKTKYLITIILVILIAPIFLINAVPKIKYRFQGMISAFEHPKSATLDSEESSLERLAIFTTSTKLAYHKLPWGVGTGDTKDEITENYKKLGSKTINERYLNAHNQYLQTTITLGILGLTSLLLILVGGFRFAIKKKNILFFSFLILISLNMLFESMLEQQAGVIFITLFYTFFCIWGDNNKIIEPKKSLK